MAHISYPFGDAPGQLRAGESENIAQIVSNFTAIAAQVNGGLDSTNLATGAVGSTQIADTAVIAAKLSAALQSVVPVAVVTSLPGSPSDGTEVYYRADDTNGVIWHLKYRAASASAYKWEYVGGAPLYAAVDTDEAYGSTAFGNLATLGPDVTAPLAGDYDIEWSARLRSAADSIYGIVGLQVAGVDSPGGDRDASTGWEAASSTVINTAAQRDRVTGLTASTLLRLRYRCSVANTINFQTRKLLVRPVRVA